MTITINPIMRPIVAAVVAIASTWGLTATGQTLTASDAFVAAPRKIMPLLDNNARLDMIDYFKTEMTNATSNAYGGRSRITSMSDGELTATLTDATRCQIAILPDGKEGLIALITTVSTPEHDSRMSVYSPDWSNDVTRQVFTRPTLADWLTADGKKNADVVETTVPFLLISYRYDPATQTLTLTNNSEEFLGKDVYDIVRPYVLDKIDYRFDGRRFARQK